MAELSRKEFLRKLGFTSVAAAVVLPSCSGEGGKKPKTTKADCNDLTGLTQQDINLREKTFKYVDNSPKPNQKCNNCQLYLRPTGNSGCGGCTLFKGQVSPEGYCTSWAPIIG